MGDAQAPTRLLSRVPAPVHRLVAALVFSLLVHDDHLAPRKLLDEGRARRRPATFVELDRGDGRRVHGAERAGQQAQQRRFARIGLAHEHEDHLALHVTAKRREGHRAQQICAHLLIHDHLLQLGAQGIDLALTPGFQPSRFQVRFRLDMRHVVHRVALGQLVRAHEYAVG